MSKPGSTLSRIIFGLFILLVLSLGLMKPTIDLRFAPVTPTDLVFPLVFLGWLLALATGVIRFRWLHEYWALIFYLATLLISCVFSVDQRLSFGKLVAVCYLILLAVVTSSIMTSWNRLRTISLVWLAGAVIPIAVAIVGAVLFYAAPDSRILESIAYHSGAVPVGNFPRISSTFVSPSMFCNYLTVTLVLALLSVGQGWIRKNLATGIVVGIGLAAIFTVSIALGGLFLAAGLWLWIGGSSKVLARLGPVLGVAVAACFLAISPFALERLESLSPSSRLLVWRDALAAFVSDPLTGKGLGTAVAGVTFQNYDGSMSLLTDAHNIYLSLAAQAGILGLAGIVTVIVVTLRAALKPTADASHRYVQLCLGAAFFAAFVYDGVTGSFEDARHLWVLIGLILGVGSIQSGGNNQEP